MRVETGGSSRAEACCCSGDCRRGAADLEGFRRFFIVHRDRQLSVSGVRVLPSRAAQRQKRARCPRSKVALVLLASSTRTTRRSSPRRQASSASRWHTCSTPAMIPFSSHVDVRHGHGRHGRRAATSGVPAPGWRKHAAASKYGAARPSDSALRHAFNSLIENPRSGGRRPAQRRARHRRPQDRERRVRPPGWRRIRAVASTSGRASAPTTYPLGGDEFLVLLFGVGDEARARLRT